MKPTAQKYAQALYEAVKQSKPDQAKQVIRNFVSLLAANNDIAKAEKIISLFDRIWKKEQGVAEVQVESARKLDKTTLDAVRVYLRDLTGADEVEIKENVDKSILGGVVFRHEDKIWDGSLRSNLIELKNKIIK